MLKKHKHIAFLNIDLEAWMRANLYDSFRNRLPQKDQWLQKNAEEILEFLHDLKVKATFFCVSKDLRDHVPHNTIQKIQEEGHEIASHGLNHLLLNRLSDSDMKREIRESKSMLEDLTQQKVYGFRAPSYSISHRNIRALDMIREAGYQYDASLNTIVTPLGGLKYAPRKIVNDNGLLLFPMTGSLQCGIEIPYCGGFYLRFWPEAFLSFFINSEKPESAVSLYFHTWEIHDHQDPKTGGAGTRFIHHYGRRSIMNKIRKLCSSQVLDFQLMKDVATHKDEYPYWDRQGGRN